jgi:spermidine synthase
LNALNIRRANLLSIIYLCWAAAIFTLFSILKTLGGIDYADIIFYLYSLMCGLLTGESYPILAESLLKNKFNQKNISTTIYSTDLAGAFLGTLAYGILLIPFLGITESLIFLLTLNAIFALKNLRH